MEPLETQVVKGGRVWFDYQVRRNRNGLELQVKTVPEVEDFIKRVIGTGLATSLETYGRNWTAVGEEPLEVYELARSVTNTVYDFDHVASTDLISSRTGAVNLGFLRFVGLSGENGIRFVIRDVFSRSRVREILDMFGKASRAFAQDYVVPLDYRLELLAQPGRQVSY